MRHSMPMRLSIALMTLVVIALAPGCMQIEQHIYVEPDGGADLGFAMRLPPPLGPMLSGMMEGQMPEAKDLPPGAEFNVRTEGLDTVLDTRLPGDAIPNHAEIFGIERETRLLSSTYRLEMDPNKLREMGEALQLDARRPSAEADVRFTQFGGGMPNLDDMGGMMEGLGGVLGGLLGGGGEGMPSIPGMDIAELAKQMQMSIIVHMPGRLTDSNGEQIDESSAKWPLDIEALSSGKELPAIKAESEGAVPAIMADLSARLGTHHDVDITPEALGDIVMRNVLPNPPVEEAQQGDIPIDTHLYGELATVIVALDETVGSESTGDVLDALGLLGEEPSLSRATKAAKRISKLEEQDLTSLSVDDVAGLLTGE